MARRALAGLLAAAAALSGCSGGSDATDTAAAPASPPTAPPAEPPSGTQTQPPPRGTTALSVYFLRDGRIAAAHRRVPRTEAVARAALAALAAGPTAAEREAGLTTRVPPRTEVERLAVANGAAEVDFAGDTCPSMAQVVFTLTQFPTVARVRGDCLEGFATRADFEDVAPPILVESPTVGETATSPLRIRGSANVFEATFMVNVVDWDGRIVAERVVTATSGTGTRGTFDVSVPFSVDRPGGALIAFEPSAKDGSPLHTVEIPLRLQPG